MSYQYQIKKLEAEKKKRTRKNKKNKGKTLEKAITEEAKVEYDLKATPNDSVKKEELKKRKENVTSCKVEYEKNKKNIKWQNFWMSLKLQFTKAKTNNGTLVLKILVHNNKSTYAQAGNPVIIASGAYILNESDFILQIIYKSENTESGIFATGWQSYSDIKIIRCIT